MPLDKWCGPTEADDDEGAYQTWLKTDYKPLAGGWQY